MSDRKDYYDDPFAFKTLANVIKLNPPVKMEIEEEICIPKCQKCGIHKCQIIGKNACMWFCSMCGEQ